MATRMLCCFQGQEHPNSLDAPLLLVRVVTRAHLCLLGGGAPELFRLLDLALLFNKGTPDGSKRFWFGNQNIFDTKRHVNMFGLRSVASSDQS